MRLGGAATLSLLGSLVVMSCIAETPQVGAWFLASAALAGLAYGTAILAACCER
jgi:hypothetical protein